jgi:hypothetical protein
VQGDDGSIKRYIVRNADADIGPGVKVQSGTLLGE